MKNSHYAGRFTHKALTYEWLIITRKRYLQFQLPTQRQDDNYLVLGKQNEHELNIQAQVQNKKKMKYEHVMEKELILSDKEHGKLEYKKCLKVFEVEPFIMIIQ